MPQRLDRNEAIALAQQGKDAWNEWAAQNPGTEVDFSGATLRDISFAGFQFSGQANFADAQFPSAADFTKATFSSEPRFHNAMFHSAADFTDATFSRSADAIGWSYASLGIVLHPVNFKGATFCSEARFIRAKFRSDVNFIDATFISHAVFIGANFSSEANFSRAKFTGQDSNANFNEAKFSSVAQFSGAKFFSAASFSGGSFLHQAKFGKTYFGGLVNFENQEFKLSASFSGAQFSQAPRFHGASIHQGTGFGSIDNNFHGFEIDEAEQCYQTLKLAMGKQQARTEEAAFAALELKARRYRLMREVKTRPFWKRLPIWAECLGYCSWEFFSKSGRGFLRPLAGYLISWAAFAASYVLPCNGWRGDWWAGIHYAFLKQFPFAAAFRGGTNHFSNLENALFAATPLQGWVSALNSLQSLIALTLIFLMGLGIRHKFRLR